MVSSVVEEEKRGTKEKGKRKWGEEKRQREGRRREVGGGRGKVEGLGCLIQDHQLVA